MPQAVLTIIVALLALPLQAAEWPAENFNTATTIYVEGMDSDLSGAHWSSIDNSLWVVRQGRQVWKLQEIDGQFQVTGHWTSLPAGSDLESITKIEPDRPNTFCVLNENNGTLCQFDTSDGNAQLINNWTLTAFGDMPSEISGDGPEAVTFVPNEHLGPFVDQEGRPYTGINGYDGLLFVGHQYNGHIYVFDLNPSAANSFTFVGEYITGRSEVAALEFDPVNGLLYIFHNSDGTTWNETEITDLSSTVSDAGRRFTTIGTYSAPPGAGSNDNIEGIAIAPSNQCDEDLHRYFFAIMDGGDDEPIKWFHQFPCDCNGNVASDAAEIADGNACNCNANTLLDSCETITTGDYNADGHVGVDDYQWFEDCLSGPDNCPSPSNTACINTCLRAFDIDGSGTVDLHDFFIFTELLSASTDQTPE